MRPDGLRQDGQERQGNHVHGDPDQRVEILRSHGGHRIRSHRVAQTQSTPSGETQTGQCVQRLGAQCVPALGRPVVLLQPYPDPASQRDDQQEERNGDRRHEGRQDGQPARSRSPCALFLRRVSHEECDRRDQGDGEEVIDGVIEKHQKAVDRPDDGYPNSVHLTISTSFSAT